MKVYVGDVDGAEVNQVAATTAIKNFVEATNHLFPATSLCTATFISADDFRPLDQKIVIPLVLEVWT